MLAASHMPDLGPRGLRLFGSRVGRSDILHLLILATGMVALGALVDIKGFVAELSTHGWSWLLGELWALLIAVSIGSGMIASRRTRELAVEALRRQEAEQRLVEFTERASRQEAAAAETLSGESAEWSWAIDADQRLTKVSDHAPSALVELARGEAPWRPGGVLADDDAWVRHRSDLVRGRAFQEFQFRIADPDAHGGERHLQISGWPVHDQAGQLIGFRGIGTDVTRAAIAEAEVRHLSTHDPMTGLAHRGELCERLAQALARARHGEAAALLCLNLDRFSEINDTLGPGIGDQLIISAAGRLQLCLDAPGTVARIGGDEFAILQPRAGQPSDADALCQKLRACLAEPFEIEGHSLTVTAGIGVVLIPGDGGSADELLKHADIALRWAKGEGPGSHCRFEQGMGAELHERTALEADLWHGFAAGQFELYYQPQIAAETQAVIGLEALLRWRHPTQGLVQPREFLPVAEAIGLMVPLGAWVLREACARAAAWPEIRVSVNLSPAQFRQRGLVALVQQTLEQTGLAPERLELEITEGAVLSDTHVACEILDRLKQLGVTISIDDFGTGYSSLSYLQKFDRIKIARSSTNALGRHDQADVMVHAILGLGRVLGMEVCAEGVETAEQSAWLRAEGCTELQGFLFSRPLEAAELEAFIRGTVGAGLPVTAYEAESAA